MLDVLKGIIKTFDRYENRLKIITNDLKFVNAKMDDILKTVREKNLNVKKI